MADIDYVIREHIEPSEDCTFRVVTHLKIQNKTVLTNPDIERRKNLVKFGDAAGLRKGDIEGSINIEDKECYLQRSTQVRGDENITKFMLNRTHKEKLDALSKRERAIMSGEIEEQKQKKIISVEREEFSVKVSNLPDNVDETALMSLFKKSGNVRKVFIPKGRDDNSFRDFAFIHYDSKREADQAIKMFKDFPLGHHILSVEMADRRNQRRGGGLAGAGGLRGRGRGK